MDFIAIDIETANSDMSSICQIGLVKYSNGKIIDTWVTLVNPNDYFDARNIGIHGITEADCKGAPSFEDVFPILDKYINGGVVAHHMPFDRVSINKTITKYDLPILDTQWLDTAKLARRTWLEVKDRGYGLKNLATNIIGYEFKHHDALEDAKACAVVLCEAMKISNISLDEVITKVSYRVSKSSSKAIPKDGNPDGSLFGENLVFTGSLEIPRKDASIMASELGCSVKSGVTKSTTMLVVGDQDLTKLAGKHKSSKHLKAELLITNGQLIRIMKESDFKLMLESQK